MFSNQVQSNTKDTIRANPATVFGYNDIRGVENAFKSLLYVFSEEASKGHGKEIIVTMNLDGLIKIEFVGDRVLNLGEANSEGIEWRKRLVDCDVETSDYVEFLFSKDEGKEKPRYDRTYDFSILACNMYVSEFMGVASDEVEKTGKFKYIIFEDGESLTGLVEDDGCCIGTSVSIKYDSNVFSDVDINKGFLESCLDEAAMLNPGIKYGLLYEELEECYDCQSFCYDDMFDYIKKISKVKDHHIFYGEEESVENGKLINLRVGCSWNENPIAEKRDCYLNQHKLIDGKIFIDVFFADLRDEINNFLIGLNLSSRGEYPKVDPVTIRELKQRVNVVLDIRTGDYELERDNGTLNRISDSVLTEMIKYISGLSEFVGDCLDNISSWREIEHFQKNHSITYVPFDVRLENSIIDYENGDGKSAFFECLADSSHTEKDYLLLIGCIEREVCKKEGMYYYIMLTQFAEFITEKDYELLENSYRSHIGNYLPNFFEIDERFEKIFDYE